ncbi:hypothetical protein Tcan_07669 [Toxocara canis]|uniref:Uncharacterized protein n=1 Tax=Toxocara canis TaxID=6265 RepID=A0A0B2VNE1_TOXCA|nr:hypothetical protein Tcan_07669 [Toxocara canis]
MVRTAFALCVMTLNIVTFALPSKVYDSLIVSEQFLSASRQITRAEGNNANHIPSLKEIEDLEDADLLDIFKSSNLGTTRPPEPQFLSLSTLIVHEEQSEDVFTHRNETIISTNKTDETSSSSEESSEEGSGKRLEGRNCEHEVEGHKCGHKQRDHKGRHGGDSVSSSDGQSHEVIERFSGEVKPIIF